MSKKHSTRKNTRRRRATWVIVQCVLIYVMCYFPAYSWWGRPEIPMFMAAVFTVLATAKCKSVKAGFGRGLVFGILAGMAIWGGMEARAKEDAAFFMEIIDYPTEAEIAAKKAAEATAAEADDAATGDTEAPAEDAATADIPADAPTETEAVTEAATPHAPEIEVIAEAVAVEDAAEPAKTPKKPQSRLTGPPTDEDRKLARESLDAVIEWQNNNKVPFFTIPTTVVVCSCIGLYFGARSQQRGRKTESEWHTI